MIPLKDIAKVEEKKLRISKEIKRLESIFKNIPDTKIKSVNSLIKNAAFMTITLEELQDSMNEDGVISHYQNGENQWGTKKSPEADIYNSMIKNHMSIIKQLCDLIPDNEISTKKDALLEFLKK